MTRSTASERISSFMSQFLMRAYCMLRFSASRFPDWSSSAASAMVASERERRLWQRLPLRK